MKVPCVEAEALQQRGAYCYTAHDSALFFVWMLNLEASSERVRRLPCCWPKRLRRYLSPHQNITCSIYGRAVTPHKQYSFHPPPNSKGLDVARNPFDLGALSLWVPWQPPGQIESCAWAQRCFEKKRLVPKILQTQGAARKPAVH